ncbi:MULTISPECIES: helix-turn-helix domain-containing protein [Niallia]|uniref:Helix-turn-helix domain-containing protein n=1 Tax=Niallia hominis TaxID=3133173 RepID=A0ABV1EWB8_9BACI|nr:helix-turn-helix domain-containing protein [Niallia circulans]MCF2650055.1 hypothetical protein [Niallia circulans]
MEKDINAIVKKMNDLFITERKKYIIQKEDGTYNWLDIKTNENTKVFHDGMLISHLNRKYTYGIFCGRAVTKFISFDVDVPSKEVVQSIYQVLNQIGISSEFIYTSWSGTKGYHVDVYFSEVIGYLNMVKLFDYVEYKVLQIHIHIEENKIECRPSPNQGLKLPLGINRKSKDMNSNVCWYVNNDFQPIKKLDYILDIKQIDKNQILTIIKRLPTIESEGVSKNEPGTKKGISDSATHYKQIKLSETQNYLQNLLDYGLRKKGTRHKSLLGLAKLLNTRNLSSESCEKELREWMINQKKEYYDTPLETCFKEISRIVEGVYSKNIVLGKGEPKTKITISRNDLLTIHQYPKKFHKTINALFIHSKRFADENGEFYMTYEQISKAAPCSLRTAMDHIKSLEELKIINVTRSPVLFEGETPYNLPNIYQLSLDLVESDKDIAITVDAPVLEKYSHIRTILTLKAFPNEEWMDIDNILKKTLHKNTETNK